MKKAPKLNGFLRVVLSGHVLEAFSSSSVMARSMLMRFVLYLMYMLMIQLCTHVLNFLQRYLKETLATKYTSGEINWKPNESPLDTRRSGFH